MDGLDHATPIDAVRRRLRRIRPPTASIAFRQRAWRGFGHTLDPLGAPRALAEAEGPRNVHTFGPTTQKGETV
jgi:hypothetical protein